MLDIHAKANTTDTGSIESDLIHIEVAGGGHQIATEMVMIAYHILFEIAYQNQVKKKHKNYDTFSKEVTDDVSSMIISMINNMGPSQIEGLVIESIRRSMDKIKKEVKVLEQPKAEEPTEEEALPSNDGTN